MWAWDWRGCQARSVTPRGTQPVTRIASEDEALVARAQRGDRVAFEALVRRHAEHLYAVILRFVGSSHEAEEITQEAFLRAWRGLPRFEARAQFFTWLYRIAINEAKRHAARRPASEPVPIEQSRLEDAPDLAGDPDRRVAARDLRVELERAVRALPLNYRAALILRDIEGFRTRAAAEILELSEAALS